jgi:uncharacterized protein YjbI with pentapeptide repeats
VEIVKDTSFEIGWVISQARPPRHSLTVVVKGTFELVPSGECPIAAEQALLTGDEHHEGDIERSLRHASDFALLKPRAECWLTGTYRAPNATPVTAATVAFRVGQVAKRLALVGDRSWKTGVLGGATDPVPFHTLELCWERCFGGPGFEANPAGRGIAPAPGGPRLVSLPNIESPTAMVRSPGDRPAPAGAFPIAPGWASRRALAGTHDERWRTGRWPYHPDDFSFAFYNAAPHDQQIDGYFRGDEEIELLDLHPQQRVIRCRLPGVRARVFLEPAGPDAALREVALHLDTIALDADTLRAHCVWRGLREIAGPSLDEFARVFVVHEPIGQRREPVECQAWFERRRAEIEAEEAALAPQAPPGPAAATPATPATPAELRDRVARAVAEGRSCARWELIDADLSGLDLRRADLTRALLTRARLGGAVLDEARLDGASLDAAELGGASLRAASLDGAVLTGARGAGANFDGAVLDGASAAEASLPGASFVKTSLRRADLPRADLTGARFEDAALDGADLSGAVLEGAVLVRSTLIDTWLEGGVRAARARFDGCDLGRLRASEGADLSDASLQGVKARGARFGEARLDRADLSGAELDEADFSRASLVEANLGRCSLRRARFQDASMAGVRLDGSDLYQARLEGADLRRADLRGASLFGAEVWRANLEGARLDGADLTGTKLA